MREISNRNFGLLIAYLVPGFVALWGASFLVDDLSIWLVGPDRSGPAVGGFLYVTVGSVAAGMIANVVRWAVIDSVHHLTGLKRPQWSDSLLHKRVEAYEWLIENHYRHYQFYGNMMFSVIFAYICWHISLADTPTGIGWLNGAIGALLIVLAAGTRTTLARYYRRSESLLGSDTQGE